VSDNHIESQLSDFFSLIGSEKRKQKEEMDSLVGDSFDKLFIEQLKPKKKVKKSKVPIVEIEEQPIKKTEVANILTEGLLNILPQEKTPDPLTPLNQNFATLDDLQNHYRLFLNRIQQQLSTLGGGGETQLRYLDDIVGIATNPSAYGDKYLQYNHSLGKFEFTDPSDSGETTITNISGITTYYQATNTDDYIGVNANVPVTIVLPLSPIVGKKLIVKDEGNKIATYNITVQAGAGTSVENDISVIMNINHQSLTYFYNNSNWFLI
jgi:hypothetical protein